MYVCTYIHMYVCMYLCTYICMYVCTYVCMHVRMYVCMYVCTYVRVWYYCLCKCIHHVYVHMLFGITKGLDQLCSIVLNLSAFTFIVRLGVRVLVAYILSRWAAVGKYRAD